MADTIFTPRARTMWRLALAVLVLVLTFSVCIAVRVRHEHQVRFEHETGAGVLPLQEALPARRPVDSFTEFVADNGPTIGTRREATSRGIIRLARAITELADADGLRDTSVRVALLDLSARGRALAQISPDSLTHADIAREAFVWAAGLLVTLQERRVPREAQLASRVEQLEATARDIRSDEPLSDQHQKVLRFFREAADVLQRLAQATPSDHSDPVGS